MVRLFLVVVLGGCGRCSFESDVSAPDSSCVLGPFSSPIKLAGPIQSTTSDDWFPTPVSNGTALMFATFRAPSAGADLWLATRPDPSSDFSQPARIVELASTSDDSGPTITDDGRQIVFFTDPAAGSADLWFAERASPDDPWPPPMLMSTLNSTNTDRDPFISGDGRRLVFSSTRSGSVGGDDLYEATRETSGDAFAAPVHLAELASTDDDKSPTLSADGLEIFFTSRRTGGPGGADIYAARRPALDQQFGSAQVVLELSSPFDEHGLRLQADGKTLFLNYDTLTAGGRNADLWIATRDCI